VELVVPEVATWQNVARRLASNQALVEYLLSDSGAIAFVLRTDTIAIVDLGMPRSDIARLIEFARGTMTSRSPGMDSLWRAPLRQLYQRLVAPIEDAGLLAGATRLIVVPQAELNYLPFAALVDGANRFFIERYELAETPSASVWLTLGDRRRPSPTGGVLALAPEFGSLPASRQEVAAIQRLSGPNVRVLSGAAASESAFRREAPVQRVLHLASYGVLNQRNPLFSYVQLAPGGEYDGRLEVHEVLGLNLAADLVVLSACQTGLGSGALADVPTGDDWVGLTRAFLHAGATNVVATLWPVDDWGTAALMETFYQRYTASADPVGALASAQRTLIARPTTAHPFYWAGFMVAEGAK
jgi:CHAT domain-containing protein